MANKMDKQMKKLIPKTKRSRLITGLMIVTFAGIATLILLKIFAASAQIVLTSSASTVNKDDTFVVNVTAKVGAEPTTIVQAYLNYDSTKVSYVSTDYTGSGFDSDIPDAGVGSGYVQLGRFTSSAKTGDILVAKVTFKAIASSGAIPISVDSTKSYIFGTTDAANSILTGVTNTSVTVNSTTTPPPPPATEPPAKLVLSASPTSVQKDGTFVVTVNGDSGTTPINAAQAFVTFDPTKVSYVSTDYTGSGLDQTIPDAGAGTGYVQLGRFTSGTKPTGSFLLGKITFKAVAESGEANIAVDTSKSSILSNTTNNDVLASANNVIIALVPTTTPLDQEPPSTPTNVKASVVSSSQIDLSWSASTDNVGVTKYQIYDGSTLVNDNVTGTSYSITGLADGKSYSYTVVALDAAGNVSTASSATTASTPTAPDTTPPTAPTNLSATAVSSVQVNLTWTASTDNKGVDHYVLYRDGDAVGGASNLKTLSFTDSNVVAGSTYKYTLVAFDTAGNNSDVSNEASVTTPAPVPPPTTGSDETTTPPPVVVPIPPTGTPVPTTPPQVPQGTRIQPRVGSTTQSGKAITKTDYSLNGNYVGTGNGDTPVNIDTSNLAPGTYDITSNSTAADGSTESGSQKVTITSNSFLVKYKLPIIFSSILLLAVLAGLVFRMFYTKVVPFYKTI